MSDDLLSTDPRPQSGSFDGPVHRYALRVFYEDTDAGGVVYHANYIRWFERARSDLLDMLDIDQRAALESGEGLYTVAEVNIRYLSPARLGDAVVIETDAIQIGRVSCTLRQVARRGKTRLAEGVVKVGFISPEGRPRRQPEAWQRAFHTILQSSSQDLQPGPEGQE
ncbi:YbgC/FadM family acyl-CoA thioesterase [Novosphingobium sp. BL-8A]|uniref:YbgC/FadM family acyl-CoA thioesterase n=1 Tax=Novosphingobium sp. BL-8A TaxID=3127639 RepID=UPI0037569351